MPASLIELSSQIIMHKFNAPAWLKHIQKANAALGNLTLERMALLKVGEVYVWLSKETDESFSEEPFSFDADLGLPHMVKRLGWRSRSKGWTAVAEGV